MEDHKKHIEAIMNQASTAKAPSDMASRVLQGWKAQQAITLTEQPPLIATWVWAIIGLLFAGIVAIAIVYGTADVSSTPIADFIGKFEFNMPQGLFEVNRITAISLAVFSMMIGLAAYRLSALRMRFNLHLL